jgi:hypothetical protein
LLLSSRHPLPFGAPNQQLANVTTAQLPTTEQFDFDRQPVIVDGLWLCW